MEHYRPLVVKTFNVVGIVEAMAAMRLPKGTVSDSKCKINRSGYPEEILGPEDARLAKKLILAGDDHAKAMRGIVVWAELEMQTGFMIEFETYRHGVECLSTSSTMHNELKGMNGPELAEAKQKGLVDKVYTRICTISYQALRAMYFARRRHRHPDWQIFCRWIETLPYAAELITVERKKGEYE